MDYCETPLIHEEHVLEVEKKMHTREKLHALALLYKLFADDTRIRILDILRIKEMCVCDIGAVLGMEQSAVSHQLKVLREANLICANKIGKVVYYRLADDHVKQILKVGLSHIEEEKNGRP